MKMEAMEEKLRRALRRKEPSGDFPARILARLEQQTHRQPWWRTWFVAPDLRWAAAVLLCVFLAGGVVYQHWQTRRRAAGEAAREQVMLALRIAGTKVRLARDRVQQISDRSSRRD